MDLVTITLTSDKHKTILRDLFQVKKKLFLENQIKIYKNKLNMAEIYVELQKQTSRTYKKNLEKYPVNNNVLQFPQIAT